MGGQVPVVDTVTTPASDIAEYDVVFTRLHDSKYEPKVYIESPPAAHEILSDLDWESTHSKWDDDVGMREIDLAAVPDVATELSQEFSVAIGATVAKALGESDILTE